MLIKQTRTRPFKSIKAAIDSAHSRKSLSPDGPANETPISCRALELRGALLLSSPPQLRPYSRGLQCCIRNGAMVLGGALPSYYLKQLAQESLRELDGIDKIENRISVIAPAFIPQPHVG